MRLNSSKTVGDGLLLGLLERKSVVQGARDQVGKGAQQQYLFLGKIRGLRRFHIEDAV